MKNIKEGMSCKHCGAPATTEICPYCHKPTGINATQANLDYPLVNCKPAHINKNELSDKIFGIFLSVLFLIPLWVLLFKINYSIFIPILIVTICLTICAFASFIIPTYRMITRNSMVKKYGKKITATVYGYVDTYNLSTSSNDNTNNSNSLSSTSPKTVKLLLNSKQGKKFILYPLGINFPPFPINKEVNLIYYKDYFLLLDIQKYLKWKSGINE